MNILFLFVSLPHLNDSNSIYTSLIHEFRHQGHDVYVSTKGLDTCKTRVMLENGIPVLRIKSNEFTGVKNSVKKALAYQEYVLKQIYFTLKKFKNKRFDLIISHSLPPELALTVGLLKRKFKCPLYLIQSDFTWQDAVAFGYFSKNGLIGLYYRFWEKQMFKRADYIGCPTIGNIKFIKDEHSAIPYEKFDFLPFWQKKIDISANYNLKNIYGFENKFIVIYGGSVGAAQRIEHIVELADVCKDYNNIQFVILGRGAYLDVIQQMIKDKQLNNIIIKTFLPQIEYLQFLASCDVGLIILNEKMATPNFPSKSLSYLNMKIPILAALDHVTDFGQYLTKNKIGLWAYSDDIQALKEELLKYYQSESLRRSTVENGYKLYTDELTPGNAYKRIISKISGK